ncbi:hypothetical protein ACJJTC_016699 [Scirpophaga incertulas]
MLYCFICLVLLVGYIEGSTYSGPVTYHDVFDSQLYEDVIDPEECNKQLSYLLNNNTQLMFKFLDSSARTPRRILKGNFVDLGSYWECLDINEVVSDMTFEGKYCLIDVPLQQENRPNIPGINPTQSLWSSRLQEITSTLPDKTWLGDMKELEMKRKIVMHKLGIETVQTREEEASLEISFELAICIPKVCRTNDTLSEVLRQNFTFTDKFCRLPNDKPWVGGDYAAISIFSIVLVLTILSTSYDVRHTLILKRDPQKANRSFVIFSVYTNCRRFFTFKSNPEAIECLDGIRSFAMFWVIIGHTFVNQLQFIPANPLDLLEFMQSFWSLWITSAPITVDTFFLISGMLLVYTTAAKVSRMSLIKRLHLFYLNRLLRMFPVLAVTVLLQLSILNWITDGPYWSTVAFDVAGCRKNWWLSLLYVQNYVDTNHMCLRHSWYLAIDMQLYIIAPMVLFWVLGGNKRSAWTALVGSFIAVMAGSAIYNTLKKFPSAAFALSRPDELVYYSREYYIHVLPRAAPFFIGLVLGYVLHLCRGRTINLPRGVSIILWLMAIIGSSASIIITYFVIQPDWENQVIDTIVNSVQRPIWAAAIAWMIFACKHGYGGPINWILTLHIFKIFGRLSYAIYLLHYPLIYIHNATTVAPIYFSTELSMHRFFVDATIGTIAAFLVTIFIDSPCSAIIGMFLGGSKTKAARIDPKKNDELKNEDIQTTSENFNEMKSKL